MLSRKSEESQHSYDLDSDPARVSRSARGQFLRNFVGLILLSLLAYEGLQPYYATFLWRDRRPWVARFAAQPDRRDPAFGPFLRRIEETTPPGSSIVIVTPNPDWYVQYGFMYFRALYVLEGRHVLPALSPLPDNTPRVDRLSSADFVAGWRTNFHSPLYDPIWSNDLSSLSRRKR